MKKAREWIYKTNVYEVNLRQYTAEGSFEAFRKHLPRLASMGVETLWFMPLTPISEKFRKGTMGSYYACSDYTSINPEFGTGEELKALIKEAKENGFKIMIDWVANHTGWDHVWTRHHPEWYKKDEDGDFLKASGMDDIIELDFSVQPMRRAMIDAMRWWVREYDIDGFRCDLASWVELGFWIEAKAELDQLKDLFWLAEADPLESADYMHVFDAAYTWKWMHRTKAFYEGHASFHELVSILQEYREAPGLPAWFTSNHDENSWNGSEYEKYGRLAPGLAVFSFTFPGVPLVYSGQEMANEKRLEFFEKDILEWEDTPILHDFYKTLFELKKLHPALHVHAAYERIHTSADEKILAYLRKYEDDEVLVLINFTSKSQRLEIYDHRISGSYTEIFTREEKQFSYSFLMEPWDYLVYVK
jgi:alpha-amylase